jgi:hypothetical protein
MLFCSLISNFRHNMIVSSFQNFLPKKKVNPIKLLFIVFTPHAPNYYLLQVGNWWRARGVAWQALTSKWLRSIILYTWLSLVLVSSYLAMLSFHYCYFVMKCSRANVLDMIWLIQFMPENVVSSYIDMVVTKRNHLILITSSMWMNARNQECNMHTWVKIAINWYPL